MSKIIDELADEDKEYCRNIISKHLERDRKDQLEILRKEFSFWLEVHKEMMKTKTVSDEINRIINILSNSTRGKRFDDISF